MYRLVLYYLIVLLGAAFLLSLLGILNYNPLGILFNSIFLVVICYITNRVFASVFKAPTNVESVYITSLILACIITPFKSLQDLPMLGFAAVLAVSSKYILAIKKKHIFNPVAIAVVLTAFGFGVSASWWIGNAWMTPFIVLGGLLVMRKTRREHMVFMFWAVALAVISIFTLIDGNSYVLMLDQVFLHSSFFFFAFLMFTEPLTTPPTRSLQLMYAVLIGLLFPPQVHLGSWYTTPELALVIGNVFAYLISPRQKFVMLLSEKLQIAPDIMDFVFKPPERLRYSAGQYFEWTFQHPQTDSRGNRRYFTLASSPTEDTLRIGVKFYEGGSSYKKSLQKMDEKVPIVAAQLAGEFILPNDKTKKLVFVAGGIGVTPFRSMLKYLIDTKEKRDIIVLFSNKYESDIVYKDILDQAERELGIRTVYTLTDTDKISPTWTGEKGRISSEIIQKNIPDWRERFFYLSGPHAMVVGFETTLRQMGLPASLIKKDFFPGFV